MHKTISLLNVIPPEKRSKTIDVAVKSLDRLLAINKLDELYRKFNLSGLAKDKFAKALLDGMQIKLEGLESLQQKIPTSGPLVIASNHPFGGIEGVILSWAISQVRPDLKVMANKGLKIFPELADYFIFTNPLSEKDPVNGPSIRRCVKHVKDGGALLLFPAGRVSYYQKDKQRITDHNWNRLVSNMLTRCNASYLPVFVDGHNSALFYSLGRIYYRLRMLMLPRELLNKAGSSIKLCAGNPLFAAQFKKDTRHEEKTALCRALSYAQDPIWQKPWPADPVTHLKPLTEETPASQILKELKALPKEQHLFEQKGLDVYFAHQQQIPRIVGEIARLRELVFREHNEGSGEPLDTDKFDASYTHLFVVNRESGQIIGAYRMGQSDKLLAEGNIDNLYLSRMFAFGESFINRQGPCLEMGRSFLIPEYQRSFLGLYLLWRGIGAFVCKFPHYRTLYGTVSLSKMYDPRSVALIEQAMVTPTTAVKPHAPFKYSVHPELVEFAKQYPLEPHLASMLKSIEHDGKTIPILLKHYQKLGAKFHCLGIDKSFNDTPGLLLSVDLARAPEKSLKLYLGEDYQAYLDWPIKGTKPS